MSGVFVLSPPAEAEGAESSTDVVDPTIDADRFGGVLLNTPESSRNLLRVSESRGSINWTWNAQSGAGSGSSSANGLERQASEGMVAQAIPPHLMSYLSASVPEALSWDPSRATVNSTTIPANPIAYQAPNTADISPAALMHASGSVESEGGPDTQYQSAQSSSSELGANAPSQSTEPPRTEAPSQPDSDSVFSPPPLAPSAEPEPLASAAVEKVIDRQPTSGTTSPRQRTGSEPLGPALLRARLFSGAAPASEAAGSAALPRVHSYTPQRPLRRAPDAAGSEASSGSQSVRVVGESMLSVVESAAADPIASSRQVFRQFLQQHTCYDMMPTSGKIVVFDVSLLVKKAFFALVQHSLRSAPLWDSRRQQFVGMITITDFINILRQSYRSPYVTMDELEQHRIITWRELNQTYRPENLISIDPMATLYDAVRMLIDGKIHRLPVIDGASGNVLNILTHKRILMFLHANLPSTLSLPMLDIPIGTLGLGTTRNIAAITKETPLIVALNIFVERRVSALPIVDDKGVVVDIYAKFDAINLARERTYNNLDITVEVALSHRVDFDCVQTCRMADSLGLIINKMADRRLHRLVIVDDGQRLVGILSLSDVLSFLVR
eukprot:m.241914 g.241914  ORF g.241914 m.241914 type:complete len:611 (+) comp13933_c0_seq1:113-1945(+)